MNNQIKRQSGFTLMEVLIASFILFISLSTMTLVFNSAQNNAFTATQRVTEYSSTLLALSNIRSQLFDYHDDQQAAQLCQRRT